jgi:hypothetical protein
VAARFITLPPRKTGNVCVVRDEQTHFFHKMYSYTHLEDMVPIGVYDLESVERAIRGLSQELKAHHESTSVGPIVGLSLVAIGFAAGWYFVRSDKKS